MTQNMLLWLAVKSIVSGLIIYVTLDHIVQRLGDWYARWITTSFAIFILVLIWR